MVDRASSVAIWLGGAFKTQAGHLLESRVSAPVAVHRKIPRREVRVFRWCAPEGSWKALGSSLCRPDLRRPPQEAWSYWPEYLLDPLLVSKRARTHPGPGLTKTASV